MKNFKLALCALIAAAALTFAACADNGAETQTGDSTAESKAVTTYADTSADNENEDSSAEQTANKNKIYGIANTIKYTF